MASVAAGASLVFAVCAAALGQPPTWAELITGVKGMAATKAHGLEWPIVPAGKASTSNPTVKQCASWWNASAPAAARRSAAKAGPHPADITVMKTYGQVIGAGTHIHSFQCAYGIALGQRELLLAVAPLLGTKGPWRGQILTFPRPSRLNELRPRFNAVLGATGNLKLN